MSYGLGLARDAAGFAECPGPIVRPGSWFRRRPRVVVVRRVNSSMSAQKTRAPRRMQGGRCFVVSVAEKRSRVEYRRRRWGEVAE